MSNSEIENRKSKIDNPGTVWDRLSESLERLDTSLRRGIDPAALALKLANRGKLLRGRLAGKAEQSATTFLTFSSGHLRFGVLLSEVIEIQQLNHYSAVPRTPPFIVGVIPWRGSILTLIDLGRLFGIPESGIADYHVCIVVEAAGRRIAVAAREVEDILGIAADEVKTNPDLLGHAAAGWVAGVYDGNRLLLRLEQMFQDEKFVNWRRTPPC